MNKLAWRQGLAVASLAALGVGFWLASADAGDRRIETYTLFGGGNTDSTEQVSAWIEVFGASRVIIRTWSAKAAFHATTDADSNYSDSLTTFKVRFSDSLCCYVTGPSGRRHPVGADSIVVDFAVTATDTTKSYIMAKSLPINKELRGRANGSGLLTILAPPYTISTISGAIVSDPSGVFGKRYMRVAVTPLRRHTVNTAWLDAGGIRVSGLKGLRMVAHVVYDNK